MKKVNTKTIKKISNLAKFEFSDDEFNKYSKEFNSILEYISQIEEVDTSEVELEHNLQNQKEDVLAEDEVSNQKIDKNKLLKNATKGRLKNDYIVTSRMVGEE